MTKENTWLLIQFEINPLTNKTAIEIAVMNGDGDTVEMHVPAKDFAHMAKIGMRTVLRGITTGNIVTMHNDHTVEVLTEVSDVDEAVSRIKYWLEEVELGPDAYKIAKKCSVPDDLRARVRRIGGSPVYYDVIESPDGRFAMSKWRDSDQGMWLDDTWLGEVAAAEAGLTEAVDG